MTGNKFCSVCGGVIAKPNARMWWCDHCNQYYYDNPRPTVDVIFFNNQNQVLLVQRALEPGKGKWEFPGGFVEFDETLEKAAEREVEEELGLTTKDYEPVIYLTNYVGRYPWGKTEYRLLCLAFTSRLKGQPSLKAEDDIGATQFCDLDKLEPIDFSHDNIIPLIKEAAAKLGIRA